MSSPLLSHPRRNVALVVVPLYGLDIETDTSTNGLDPAVASVVAVGLSSADSGDVAFTGSEAEVLAAVDAHLAALGPGVIVTWNGSAFDLPFLADRAAANGLDIGLSILWDPAIRKRRDPIPGHPGAYRACWHTHAHIDAYRAYRAIADDPDQSCGLKAVARREGLDPVEVDCAQIHSLSDDELRAYVTSDARLTRLLAERRWRQIQRFADRHRATPQLALSYR